MTDTMPKCTTKANSPGISDNEIKRLDGFLADIEANNVKIEELSGSISADEKELKEATAIRNKDCRVRFINSDLCGHKTQSDWVY